MKSLKDRFFRAKKNVAMQMTDTKPSIREIADENLKKLGIERGKKFGGINYALDRLASVDYFVPEREESLEAKVEKEAEYMSDMKNYLMVHATQYLPSQDEAGDKYIKSTAQATDFEVPRNTVHITLNHIVTGHGGGNWDNSPVIVLAPFNDVVKKNEMPAELNLVDTFFSTKPDKGLVLPNNAVVVRPSNDVPDGLLFQIGKSETKYKRENYTPDEIDEILSLLDKSKKDEYERLLRGDFDEVEIEQMKNIYWDKRTVKAYDLARDKRAFLIGMFQEGQNEILAELVRNMATKMTMERMGYKQVEYTSEFSKTHYAVDSVAEKNGVIGGISNKGHDNSFYGNNWGTGVQYVYGDLNYEQEDLLKNSENLDDLFGYLNKDQNRFKKDVINGILHDVTINFYKYFDDAIRKEFSREEFYLKRYGAYKNISTFDKNLDETVKKYSDKKSQEFNSWRTTLRNIPGYDIFIKKLSDNQRIEQGLYSQYPDNQH